jgi:hypothetical protein
VRVSEEQIAAGKMAGHPAVSKRLRARLHR